MKKLIVGLIIVLFMTGCSATYKIKVKDNKIEEELTVLESSSKANTSVDESGRTFKDYALIYGQTDNINTIFYYQYGDEGCTSDCSYYDKKYTDNNLSVGFTLSHAFNFDEYQYSTLANELLPSFSSEYDGRYIKVSGGSTWNFINGYKSLDSITITLESDYKVISTNGSKNGNVYTWEITKDNYNKLKSLYFIIDTTEKVEKNKIRLIHIFLLVIVSAVIAIGYNLFKKRKQDDSI